MATIKAGGGAIKVTSSGKLATTCGAVACQIVSGVTDYDDGNGEGQGDGVFRAMGFYNDETSEYDPFWEFDNFPEFLGISGFVDDFCLISPSAVSGGSYSISASAGFAVAPNLGDVTGGCCSEHEPYGFSVTVGAATYTESNCGGPPAGDSWITLREVQDGLSGAGIFLAGKWVFDGDSLKYDSCVSGPVTENSIISKAQLQSLGFTGTTLKIYGGGLGCGFGQISLLFRACPRVIWRAHWDCIELEWTCKRAIGVTDDPLSEWASVSGTLWECVTNSLTPPDDPTPQTCRRRARATYTCFESDPDLRWEIEWTNEALPSLPLYGWSPYVNGNSEQGYLDGGVFECVVEATEDGEGGFYWELPETPPENPPNCYCNWYAYYDCTSEDWSIYLDSCYATHIDDEHENQWVGTGGYRTMVSTSNTEPSPPGDTPTCVTFWEAYWNGTSWDKYGLYTDIGEESDWACYGAEYASGAFAVGVTPADPVCEE